MGNRVMEHLDISQRTDKKTEKMIARDGSKNQPKPKPPLLFLGHIPCESSTRTQFSLFCGAH